MKPETFNLAVLQLNFRVGDPDANAATLLAGYRQAVMQGAAFVLAPELCISGYPPKDDLLHKAFIAACVRVVAQVAAQVGDIPLAFGTPWLVEKAGDYGQLAYNAYVVAHGGRVVFVTTKRYPAQGGVFDEWRVHKPGKPEVFTWQGLRLGFPICEDIWHRDVVAELSAQGVDVMLVPNGSPTYVGKPEVRQQLVRAHVAETGIPMLYLNHVGGQDEHAFDGGAFFVNPSEHVTVFAPYWQEAVAMLELVQHEEGWRFAAEDGYTEPAEDDYVLDAIVTTTRDYLLKSSPLRKVVVGVSGGVDSAVVLGIAKLVMESAGLNPAEGIIAVSLPSRHNSAVTQGFAQQVCNGMGIPLHWWPIEDAVASLTRGFADVFGQLLRVPGNVAYENTQSRERGQVLMMLANRFDALLLSTGNKSEMAMGYATLYGDMNGGFNPLKTLYKMQVYRLARAINWRLGNEAIPLDLITQKPSAELDDNQFDENSLPPYPVLDAILTRLMDDKHDAADIVGGVGPLYGEEAIMVVFPQGADAVWSGSPVLSRPPMQRWLVEDAGNGFTTYRVHPQCVLAVARQFLRMRFKRYQACPGVTITRSSLDDGENYPIANGTAWLAEGLETAA